MLTTGSAAAESCFTLVQTCVATVPIVMHNGKVQNSVMSLSKLVCRDVMDSKHAVSIARQQFKRGKSAQEVADHIARLALKRHTYDNVAVAVVDILGSKEHGWQAKKKKGGGGMFGVF